MNTPERINDILDGAGSSFYSDEVKHVRANVFQSIEHSCIVHYTNAELYYLDEEMLMVMKGADEVIETSKGTAYAFN